MADFTYARTGIFTAFPPNNKAAEAAWVQLAQVTDGTGKVLQSQEQDIIRALRNAGYSVSKAKPKVLDSMLDELYSELA